MRPVNKPAPPRLPSRKGWTLADSVESALLDTLDNYCSFCELSVESGGFLHSKRTGPLKTPPTLQDWPALLLACNYCHAWRARGAAEEGDCLWPDADATFTLDGASPFLYRMKDVNVVKESSEATAAVEPSTEMLALVVVNPAAPPDVQKRAQKTIDLYRLNTPFYDARTNTLTPHAGDTAGYVDMRLNYRTREWRRAESAVEGLRKGEEFKQYPEAYDALVKSVAATAQAAAFWSVWMTVFWEAFKDRELLTRLFVSTPTKAGYVISGFQSEVGGGPAPAGYLIFCGTAAERIKFPS